MIGLSKYEYEEFDQWVMEHSIALPVFRYDQRRELQNIWRDGRGNVFGGSILYSGQALRSMCRLLRVRPHQLPVRSLGCM